MNTEKGDKLIIKYFFYIRALKLFTAENTNLNKHKNDHRWPDRREFVMMD